MRGAFPIEDQPQPYIDDWPVWDEPLSNAAFDIEAARLKLARKFNARQSPKEEPRDGSVTP
jgi:hypothetical protein